MTATDFEISHVLPPTQTTPIHAWWQDMSTNYTPKDRRREFNGYTIYIMWNIWKELNWRIFQGVAAIDLDVVVI
jgi:hypothetical protein